MTFSQRWFWKISTQGKKEQKTQNKIVDNDFLYNTPSVFESDSLQSGALTIEALQM